MEVRIGDQGEIIGLDRNWRDLKPFQKTPPRSVQEGTSLLKQKFCREFQIPQNISTPQMLVYLMDDALNVQNYVAPFYFFRLISATDFSPIAVIESPANNAVFEEGQTIEFKTSVRFGTSPYGYAWGTIASALRSPKKSSKWTIKAHPAAGRSGCGPSASPIIKMPRRLKNSCSEHKSWFASINGSSKLRWICAPGGVSGRGLPWLIEKKHETQGSRLGRSFKRFKSSMDHLACFSIIFRSVFGG